LTSTSSAISASEALPLPLFLDACLRIEAIFCALRDGVCVTESRVVSWGGLEILKSAQRWRRRREMRDVAFLHPIPTPSRCSCEGSGSYHIESPCMLIML
jgi:hypothetical protein